MKNLPGAPLLNILILKGASGRRMWASLGAMTIGLSLLLAAVLLWWNFSELLQGRASKDDLGSTFLTVSRRVTNEAMGNPGLTVFSGADIEALAHAPQVEDVGVVQSLRPRAYMSMQLGPGAGFSTVMILEAVPDRFMDRRPDGWDWQPGTRHVPVILSSSFLSLYNYAFAPSQGLPQLSEESIKALPFRLTISEGAGETDYVAQVAGFSDRITSVLVPESFIQSANAGKSATSVSRLVLKVADPSATAFSNYLSARGYVANSEMLRWSRLRTIVQVVASVTGVFALLLLGISLLVFTLFVELTIARAQASVQLLQEIGYSPDSLRRFLLAKFSPLLGACVFSALAVVILIQIGGRLWGESSGLMLALLPGWPVWTAAALAAAAIVFQLRAAIAKALET